MKIRKRKYVVWLYNHTDRRDDDWVVVYAKSPTVAKKGAKYLYDTNRFSLGHVQTATQFRKENGFGA